MDKDYSLLKPFDLEAAKAGEPIVCKEDGQPRKFVTGPDKHGYFVVETEEGWYRFGKESDYRMAPLAWVEDKPVYKGDALYYKGFDGTSKRFEVSDTRVRGGLYGQNGWMFTTDLTWNKPKTKHEGWVNVYPSSYTLYAASLSGFAYPSEEDANSDQGEGRIACVRIEWEE